MCANASGSHERVTITLPDSTCALMALASFGSTQVGVPSFRHDDLVRRILKTPIDRSRGEHRAVRHVVLQPEEAQELLAAFRDSAETYRLASRRSLVGPCIEAAATIENAIGIARRDTTPPAERHAS